MDDTNKQQPAPLVATGFWNGNAIWDDPIYGRREIACEIHYSTEAPTPMQWLADGRLLMPSWEPTRLGLVIKATDSDFLSDLCSDSVPGSIVLPEGVTGWSGPNGEAIAAIVFDDVYVKDVSERDGNGNVVVSMTAAYPRPASVPNMG